MEQTTVVGVIGLYHPGRRFAERLVEPGETVVATDVEEDRRRSFAASSDEVLVSESMDDFFELPLDGVIVATPTQFHESPVRRCLERDTPVMVRKPLAHDLETAETVATLAAETRTDCYLSFKFRCSDVLQELARQIAAGGFGDLYHVESVWVRPAGLPAVGSWMTSRELSGGGVLLDLGCTQLDTARYLLGAEDHDQVLGVTRKHFDPNERSGNFYPDDHGSRRRSNVEDSATTLVRYDDGSTHVMDVHWASNQPRRHRFWIYGTAKGAMVDFNAERCWVYDYDRGEPEPLDVDPDHWVHDAYDGRIDRFLDAIDGEETPLATARDGLAIQRITSDVYEQSRRT
jgi:predicted dehydrogenase